jgi:hypothetical protein
LKALNFKMTPFLSSFLEVMNDELDADGSSVDTAPSVRYGGRPGDISWTTAYVALPYAIFKTGGDTSAAEKYLDGMLLHLSNIATQCKGEAGTSCPTKYGDWVPPNSPGKGQGPKPSKPYTSSFSYIDTVQKIGEMVSEEEICLMSAASALKSKMMLDVSSFCSQIKDDA